MHSLTAKIQQVESQIKGILRQVDSDKLSQVEKSTVQQIRLACNEVKLDIRDYEYSQTRVEQLKWVKVAHHNLKVLEKLILQLGTVFGAADSAQICATLGQLGEGVT